MPYIRKFRRIDLDDGSSPLNAGELNYILCDYINNYIETNRSSYQTYNDIIGVLECIKLELYRRLITPYEEKKRKENGDICLFKRRKQ